MVDVPIIIGIYYYLWLDVEMKCMRICVHVLYRQRLQHNAGLYLCLQK